YLARRSHLMSYNLIPIVVDLEKVKSAMGSKDSALVQAVVKQHRKGMLQIDAIIDDDENVEKQIKKEYKAFIAGDFSSVHLTAAYDNDDKDDDEPDPDAERFKQELAAATTHEEREKIKEAMKQCFLQKAMSIMLNDDSDDEDEEVEDEEPGRSLSTGAALVQLIFSGNLDPSAWSQYGYSLQFLCEHLGTVQTERGSWSSIRSRSFDFLDKILGRAGVPPKDFSTDGFLVQRGAPVKIFEPKDFPYIGYLKRDEIPR